MKSPSIKYETLDCQSAYDRWAPSYDAYPNPTVAMARMALERDITDVKGLNIFEFGCGTGENLHSLGGKGAGSLTGVDVSEGMLTVARARLGKFEPCLFRITEKEPTFVTDQKFDLILAVLVLEHVNDIDHFFRVAKDHWPREVRSMFPNCIRLNRPKVCERTFGMAALKFPHIVFAELNENLS